MEQILKRKIDAYLESWKNNPERKPLIVKGARQIGKTRSIEHFATQQYKYVVKINLWSKSNIATSSTMVSR